MAEVNLSEPRDRTLALLESTSLNGIDFVELVAGDPFVLRIHFLNGVDIKTMAPNIAGSITGGDRIPVVQVDPIDTATDWSSDTEGRPVLTLHVRNPGDFQRVQDPGDFSDYTLTLTNAPALDPRFTSTIFSFKAFCPSDFDCAPVPAVCPPDDTPAPPIDYTAKDFDSFRRALVDFSALRYPGWVERSEADFGMMFAEALSAVGDELSYLQDRVAAEGTVGTATQRRSLVALARMVDYEPRLATSATTLILCIVSAGTTALPAGLRISAVAADGTSVPFELGAGLADTSTFPVSAAQNYPILPYFWDDSERCLPRGATSMWVQGDSFEFQPGTAILIQTDLPGQSIREIVHLTKPGVVESDALFPATGAAAPPAAVTRIEWGPDEALVHEHDLTNTLVGANLVPATQGARVTESFAIPGASAPPNLPLAIARWGPNSSDAAPIWVFRWPLAQGPLSWLATSDAAAPAVPEILVTQTVPATLSWSFVLSLLKAEEEVPSFTVDPVAWRAIGFDQNNRPIAFDIDGDQGSTIRFGDGVFGLPPAAGDVFRVDYRVGLGAGGNVAVDAIANIDQSATGLIIQARNPLVVTTGADAETAQHVQRIAPQAFRATQFRAVRPEDYEAAAESLPWVLKAGTSFRWTGSWLTVFTAVDPKGPTQISDQEEIQLIDLLNRRRLAGYESYSPRPTHVSIDLQIEICVLPDWLPSDVERGVLGALGSSLESGNGSEKHFFFSDHFTFGSPLFRSRLEATIQAVPGVSGVRSVLYRRRGNSADFVDLPDVLRIGPGEILRVDNDRSFPERGTIRVIPEGGR